MSLEDTKKKIRDMPTEERNAFLSQESQYPDFKGQTVGQKLYGLISSYVDKKYPLDKELPFKQEMGEYLTPKVQEKGNAFTENIGENLCCAATNNTSLIIPKRYGR